MIIAIDTGGTKTLITSFDLDGHISKQQTKFPTPRNKDEYVLSVKDTIVKLYGQQKIDAIVIAVPSILNQGKIIATSNLPWSNFDIKHDLSSIFHDIPVLVENDAKLACLGETRQLKKIPTQSLYITISTGIGSGVATNGQINSGLDHSEAGHMVLNYEGKDQEWEKFASGKAISEIYGYAKYIKDRHIWNEIAQRISRGFLTIIPTLQPDVIIIGGSIGTYFNKYSRSLKKILKKELPKIVKLPKIIKAKYPELAVIYGCYYYAIDEVINKKS